VSQDRTVDTHGRRPPAAGGGARRKSTLREYAEAIGVAVLLALVIRTFVVQAFKIPSGSMLPTLQIGDHILVNKFLYGPRLEVPLTNLSFGRLPGLAAPGRGDIVVFVYPQDPSKDFIKRIVGLPGDLVELRNRKVYVNGAVYEDSHAHFLGPHGGAIGGNAPPLYVARAGDRLEVGSGSLLVNGESVPLPDRQVFRRHYGRLFPDGMQGAVTVDENQYFMMGDNRDNSQDSRVWGPVGEHALKGKAFVVYWSWDGRDRWVRWERLGSLIR
jgi:signal peptidase I